MARNNLYSNRERKICVINYCKKYNSISDFSNACHDHNNILGRAAIIIIRTRYDKKCDSVTCAAKLIFVSNVKYNDIIVNGGFV
jgi:hypothetical protein